MPQTIQNFPASIPHFPAETTFWSKFFYNTDVARSFSEQNFPWKWKSQIFDFRSFDVYYMPNMDLLDKLKEVKKPQFFPTVKILLVQVLTEKRKILALFSEFNFAE
jgi:hypothetical protein